MATVLSPTQTTTTWQVDPAHSLVEFSVRHMMVSTVKGRFTDFRGTIVQVEDDRTKSSIEIELNLASIDTGSEQRDEHLRSTDFFSVEQFPTAIFKSTRVEGSGDELTVIGDLTIQGQTREVALDVSFNGIGVNPYGATVAGFTAETKFNRKDFGLNWNVALEAGGVLVSDEVRLHVELQVVKQ